MTSSIRVFFYFSKMTIHLARSTSRGKVGVKLQKIQGKELYQLMRVYIYLNKEEGL